MSVHELKPSAEDPTPGVRVPGGDNYVWDPVVRELRNISREPLPSPRQAVKDFQTAHARYRWQVLIGDEVKREGSHGTIEQVRYTLAAVLIRELSVPLVRKVQYNCWDFHEERWVDPSTADLRVPPAGGGVMNAELKIGGGFGDLL